LILKINLLKKSVYKAKPFKNQNIKKVNAMHKFYFVIIKSLAHILLLSVSNNFNQTNFLMGVFMFRSGIRSFVLTLLFSGLFIMQAQASNEFVRISKINGKKINPNQYTQIMDVYPGDLIVLSADLFVRDYYSGDLQAVNEPGANFIWDAKGSPNYYSEECDAIEKSSCLDHSNFESFDDEVFYYVPYDMDQNITISVEHYNDYQLGSSRVILKNKFSRHRTPRRVITHPDEYDYEDYSSYNVLAGMGRWVVISGSRYWVPQHYAQDWAPYRHGYWSWTTHGWTWVSHDPWGWHTDHYGYWRYHQRYGWIWTPFSDRKWRAHTVTWFYTDGAIGWYPSYYHSYPSGYRHGYAQGFRDGYWDGYHAGRHHAHHGHYHNRHYRLGLTVVHHNQFINVNIYNVHRNINHSQRITYWSKSLKRNAHTAHPGGHHKAHHSRTWVETRVGRVPVTKVRQHRIGGKTVYKTVPVHKRPESYRKVTDSYRKKEFSRVKPKPIRTLPRKRVTPPSRSNPRVTPTPRTNPRRGRVTPTPRTNPRVTPTPRTNPRRGRVTPTPRTNPRRGRVTPTPRTNPRRVTPTPRTNPRVVKPTPRTNPRRVKPTPRTNPRRVTPTPRSNPRRVAPTPRKRSGSSYSSGVPQKPRGNYNNSKKRKKVTPTRRSTNKPAVKPKKRK